MNPNIALYDCKPLTQALSHLVAMFTARTNNLFEADRLACQFGTDRLAQKSLLIKDPYHCQIARIISNRDRFSHICGKCWINIAVALKANAISLDLSPFGNR